jgi:hypothetical protein
MKTEFFKQKFTYLMALALGFSILYSCGKEEPEDAYSFEYPSDLFSFRFRSEGTIPAPAYDFPGNDPVFSLMESPQGLSIDSTTGAIRLDRSLNAGDHGIIVQAKTNKGKWETKITLNSSLGGTLWSGGINHDPTSQEFTIYRIVWLNQDGTLRIEVPGEAESAGVGVWEFEKKVLSMRTCLYCSDKDPKTVPNTDDHVLYEGVLENNDQDGAQIVGQWYEVSLNPDASSLAGNFNFNWD